MVFFADSAVQSALKISLFEISSFALICSQPTSILTIVLRAMIKDTENCVFQFNRQDFLTAESTLPT